MIHFKINQQIVSCIDLTDLGANREHAASLYNLTDSFVFKLEFEVPLDARYSKDITTLNLRQESAFPPIKL